MNKVFSYIKKKHFSEKVLELELSTEENYILAAIVQASKNTTDFVEKSQVEIIAINCFLLDTMREHKNEEMKVLEVIFSNLEEKGLIQTKDSSVKITEYVITKVSKKKFIFWLKYPEFILFRIFLIKKVLIWLL